MYMVPETQHERAYNEHGLEIARLTALPDDFTELSGHRLGALMPDEVRTVRDMLNRRLDNLGLER